MKKILLAIVFCCGMNMVNAQSAENNLPVLQDSHHTVIGYVKGAGSIYDVNNALVFQLKNDGTILNGEAKPMGYITADQAIQDRYHNTIGYLNGAGFEDGNHKPVGSVKNDGSLVKNDNTVIGYEVNTEPMWAGLYFFYFMGKK